MQSDNGGEFIGEVVKQLCKDFDVRILHGRPHHPQTRDQIENLNKQGKGVTCKISATSLKRTSGQHVACPLVTNCRHTELQMA